MPATNSPQGPARSFPSWSSIWKEQGAEPHDLFIRERTTSNLKAGFLANLQDACRRKGSTEHILGFCHTPNLKSALPTHNPLDRASCLAPWMRCVGICLLFAGHTGPSDTLDPQRWSRNPIIGQHSPQASHLHPTCQIPELSSSTRKGDYVSSRTNLLTKSPMLLLTTPNLGSTAWFKQVRRGAQRTPQDPSNPTVNVRKYVSTGTPLCMSIHLLP